MQNFPTKDTPWTNFTKLYRINAFSMRPSEKILMHSKVNEQHVNEESCTWFTVAPMINHIGETIDLSQ